MENGQTIKIGGRLNGRKSICRKTNGQSFSHFCQIVENFDQMIERRLTSLMTLTSLDVGPVMLVLGQVRFKTNVSSSNDVSTI